MAISLSRRQFFSRAPAGAVAALVAHPPPRAWIILELNWQYNDEFSYSEGEFAHFTLYYDRAAAESACAEFNSAFYAAQSPARFEIDWATYFPDGLAEGQTESDITWNDVKERGWNDPYFVHELTIPGGNTGE